MKTKVIKLSDQETLVPTSKYPYAKFPFENFNPVQSRIIEDYNKDVNYIVASNTSSGKTCCAEMFMAYEIREKKRKAMYLSPLKALAQEKIDDWSSVNHHFSDLDIAICTGDYRLTPQRHKELEKSNVFLLTSEMLNSRARNYRSENNSFLKDVGVVICDESHGIGSKGRGDHIEVGLMKFTELNPEARIVFLSATLPNVDEVGDWLCKLNGKNTYVLESQYRPCPLQINYHKYWDVQWGYDENEKSKIELAIRIYEQYQEDKFIMFVHTKRTGEALFNALRQLGVQTEYHSADLTKEKRVDIEKRFREDPKLRVIVATSGLSQGLNMPSRRVIIVGVHRGITLVDVSEILQECGRAGRPQYDPKGDSHILLPRRDFEKQKARLEEPQYIKSQLLDPKCLAFHLISEIHHKTVNTIQDIHEWYSRSLAHYQDNELNEDIANQVINNLIKCGAITKRANKLVVTPIGTISSMFYFSPFDISDLAKNLSITFDKNKQDNDYWLAMALANVESNKIMMPSNAEKEEIAKFKKNLSETSCEQALMGDKSFTEGSLKSGCCYYNLLKGYSSASLNGTMRGLQADSERLCEVLGTIGKMITKWDETDFFKRMYIRLVYGVGEELVSLCSLRGVGKIKAKRLWDANLRDLQFISENPLKVMKALNCSKEVAEGICKNAKDLNMI